MYSYLCKGKGYSYFKGIPRLQDVAFEQGMCSLEYVEDVSDISTMNDEYYAVRVTNDYMLEKYNYKPWRDDHHILFHNLVHTGMVEYLNDMPADSGEISLEEANSICANEAIIFRVKDMVNLDFDKIIETGRNSFITSSSHIDNIAINYDNFTYEIARDAVSISKVLVKRQQDFMQLFDKSFNEAEYYDYLSSVQTKLEYMRLRKADISKCADLISEALVNEKEYNNKIKMSFDGRR